MTFEKFLEDVHYRIFPTVLDDDLPDHFDNWLGELDGEDFLRYGNLYGQQCDVEGREAIVNHVCKN